MRGLDPRIHDEAQIKILATVIACGASWIAGSSPAMTGREAGDAVIHMDGRDKPGMTGREAGDAVIHMDGRDKPGHDE